MALLTNCEFEKCPLKAIETPSKDMHTCSCGCEQTMHASCLIKHNREITHMLQTNRMVRSWQ